jgi:hypothetical protein
MYCMMHKPCTLFYNYHHNFCTMGATPFRQALNAILLLCHIHNYIQIKFFWLVFKSVKNLHKSRLATMNSIQYIIKVTFKSLTGDK